MTAQPALDHELVAAEPSVAAVATRRRLYAVCTHDLGGLPCVNREPHAGNGRGCVHHCVRVRGTRPARLRRRRVAQRAFRRSRYSAPPACSSMPSRKYQSRSSLLRG